MEVTIRDYMPGEEIAMKRVGLKAFHSMEGLFIGKPKEAKVALVGDKIVGAIYYHMLKDGKKQIGYIDYAFVDPEYHGLKIGTKLYKEAVETIEKNGALATALVKGDNVGSFHLLEENGLRKCSFFDFASLVGVKGASASVFKTEHMIATGMDFYSTKTEEKKGSLKEAVTYLLINVIIALFAGVRYGKDTPYFILATVMIELWTIFCGSMILLFTKRAWHFRFNQCGFVVSAGISMLGGWYPMTGRWFPEHYSKDKREEREMIYVSLLEWWGLVIVKILLYHIAPQMRLLQIMNYIVGTLLIYRMIPTYPFGEYGANRIWDRNKWVFIIQFILTAFCFYFLR